jgi:hypothetical protein
MYGPDQYLGNVKTPDKTLVTYICIYIPCGIKK